MTGAASSGSAATVPAFRLDPAIHLFSHPGVHFEIAGEHCFVERCFASTTNPMEDVVVLRGVGGARPHGPTPRCAVQVRDIHEWIRMGLVKIVRDDSQGGSEASVKPAVACQSAGEGALGLTEVWSARIKQLLADNGSAACLPRAGR